MAQRPQKKRDDSHEELDKYITDKFNLEIYEFVKENKAASKCEPVAFLQLLHSTYEWILQNTDKPLAIAERLKEPFPYRWYFLEKLEGLLKRKVEGDDLTSDEKLLHSLISENDKGCKRLKEAWEIVRDKRADAEKRHTRRVIAKEWYEGQMQEKRFDWATTKQHLKTLPDHPARLNYLYEAKAEYEQTIGRGFDFDNPTFGEQCVIEIQKIKNQMALEKPSRKQSGSQSETEATKRNREFTTARQVLAVHYLLNNAKIRNVDKTDIARFIEFLTGKNFDSIYKKVREPLKLKDSEARKDLEFVKAYFVKLGLSEIVVKIDNEIAQTT